jgi:hypothetical protein
MKVCIWFTLLIKNKTIKSCHGYCLTAQVQT